MTDSIETKITQIEGEQNVLNNKVDTVNHKIGELTSAVNKQTKILEQVVLLNERFSNMKEDVIEDRQTFRDFVRQHKEEQNKLEKKFDDFVEKDFEKLKERSTRYMDGFKLIVAIVLSLEAIIFYIYTTSREERKVTIDTMQADINTLNTNMEVLKNTIKTQPKNPKSVEANDE